MENFRQPFVWVSVEGQSWDRVDLSLDEASLFDLATTPFGFVAVGSSVGSDRSAVMLVSPNGRSWSQVPAANFGGETLLTDVASYRDWTYAVGDDVFVSQDGVSWIELGLSGPFRSITSFGGRLISVDGNGVVELPYPPQGGT